MTDKPDPAALHNWLSERFVRDIVGPAIRNGASDTDLMVLFESCQLGVMQALWLHYGSDPAVIVGWMEAAQHRAIERFAKGNSDG